MLIVTLRRKPDRFEQKAWLDPNVLRNKVVTTVSNTDTQFHSAGEYPKVCVNLQTDVRYNYSVWRLFLWQEEKTAHKKQQ